MHWRAAVSCALAAAITLADALAVSAQSTAAPKKPAARVGTEPRGGHTSPATFDAVVTEAGAARKANNLDEAAGLYARALKMRPAWAEGYWYLGTVNYDLDKFEVARDAFRRLTALSPKNARAWTFKGLCEFRLRSYDTALSDLLQGRTLGILADREFAGIARYHAAILFTRNEQYEQAIQTLNQFANEGDDGPRIIEAMGIALLRLPMLPLELPGEKRDQVMTAGRAGYFAAARQPVAATTAFDELVSRYPETPNVHYTYGAFLLGERPDAAIAEFKEELKVSPRHPWAKLQLAYEYIRRSDWQEAKLWAEQAASEAPRLFVARRALGQALLETNDVPGAIRELEVGIELAPDSAGLRFMLARAYRRAGRTADADREQAEFARLDRLNRSDLAGAHSVGGIEMDSVKASGTPEPQ